MTWPDAVSGLLGFVLVLAVLLFLRAWTVGFWQAWVHWLIVSGSPVFITTYFLKKDPGLLERRLRAGPGRKRRGGQRIIQSLATVALWGLIVVPGLDRHFSWSNLPVAVVVTGNVLVVLGFSVIFLVFRENTYTSGIVEVDPSQTVILTGPYSVVRHPHVRGSVAVVFRHAASPRFVVGVAGRDSHGRDARFETRRRGALSGSELPGYEVYCERVRRHLVPGLW
jgi:protein-S-isoprenylcysteine O-methyltransferase Ste14